MMCGPLSKASATLVALTLAGGFASGARAGGEPDEDVRARGDDGRLRITHQATISSEVALDTNARRQQVGGAAEADALAYLYATGAVEGRRPGRLVSASLDLGAKRFLRTSAEDMMVGRLALRWAAAPRQGVAVGAEASYLDRFQRGDPWREVEGDEHLACRPPAGPAGAGYRCNRRDYRRGALAGSLDLRFGDWSLAGRTGASFLDYKPNRQFSYGGPHGSLALSRPVAKSHNVSARAAASLRFYHPNSVTYRLVPSADTVMVQEVSEPRVEHVLSGALGWRYRGPLLLSSTVTVASSRNNGDGMDVLRARAEAAGAVRLGSSTTIVASGAFQLAHYPQGNVFRRISLRADEDERQNSIALQVTQRLTGSLALVLKAGSYSNEFSGDTLPFQRHVIHGGLRWSL